MYCMHGAGDKVQAIRPAIRASGPAHVSWSAPDSTSAPHLPYDLDRALAADAHLEPLA